MTPGFRTPNRLGAGLIWLLLLVPTMMVAQDPDPRSPDYDPSVLPPDLVDGGRPPVAPEPAAPTEAAPAPVAPANPWFARVTEFQQYQTHNEGLNHLSAALQAMEGANPQTLAMLAPAIDQILLTGWTAPFPQIVSALQTFAVPVQSAIACGEAEPFVLPPMRDAGDAMPNLYHVQMLNRMALAQAEGHLAAGRADEAARIARASLRFSWYLRAEDCPLVYHVISVGNTQRCLPTLQRILRHPALTDEARAQIGSDLFKLDTRWPPIARTVGREGMLSMDQQRRLAGDEKEREKVLATMAGAPELRRQFLEDLRRFSANEAGYRQVWSAWFQYVAKPYWERSPETLAALQAQTTEVMGGTSVPDLHLAALRDDLCRAQLRLTMALAAVRANKQEAAKGFLDPFDGQPLRLTTDRVYSVGPDQVDDRGGKRYDMASGAPGPGDITVMLR